VRHMRQPYVAAALLITLTAAAGAQERRRSPNPDGAPPSAQGAIPRNPKMPYAGLWSGTRNMPMGPGPFATRFSAADGKYQGVMIFPDGNTAPWAKVTSSSSGLTMESPNSGGGTWVYSVRLAGPDSMVGTLILRDAPAVLNPPPRGTLVLKRQRPAAARGR
jgi:hypothetical protein